MRRFACFLPTFFLNFLISGYHPWIRKADKWPFDWEHIQTGKINRKWFCQEQALDQIKQANMVTRRAATRGWMNRGFVLSTCCFFSLWSPTFVQLDISQIYNRINSDVKVIETADVIPRVFPFLWDEIPHWMKKTQKLVHAKSFLIYFVTVSDCLSI